MVVQTPAKSKVVRNKSAEGSLAAQQFQVRLGKDTTVPVTLGFTKSNELFVGRMAMLGFAAATLGEVITGKGALAQFNIETGVPITDIDGVVAAIVVFNIFAALLPAKGKLVLPEEDVVDNRPKGSLQDPSISMLQPKKFFGFSGFGFTKANELFVGRMAQLGFAFSLIGGMLLQFNNFARQTCASGQRCCISETAAAHAPTCWLCMQSL
jgi:photosystem II 22kDa protein